MSPPPSGSPWIFGPKSDLGFIVLSPLLSPLLVGLWLALTRGLAVDVEQAARVFYFVFAVFFDHPHIWQTFSRTHFDAVERRRHFVTHHWLLGGALAGALLFPQVTAGYWFQTAFDIFGLWHIYAQNAGFLKVYGRLTGTAETDRKLGRVFFNLVFNAYLVRVCAVDLGKGLDEFGPGGPALLAFLEALKWGLAGGALGVGTAMALRRATWRANGRTLFLGALLVSYGTNFAVVGLIPPAVMLVFDTLYHDVQYLRWIVHYQKGQARPRWWPWAWGLGCTALALTVYFGGPTVASLFIVVTIYHYYIDGVIWKFGTQPELKPLLQSAEGGQPHVVVEAAAGNEGKRAHG